MNEKGFLKNIIIIIILLAVVFLSQQPYFLNGIGKKLYFQSEAQVKTSWVKITDWFKSNVYPRVSGEVEQKGAIIQREVNKQKNNIMQSIWEKIKNYFADIFSKVSGTLVQ